MKNKFIVLGMALVSVCSLASCKKTKSDDYNRMIELLNDSKFVHFKGFHSHIGSQIFDFNVALSPVLFFNILRHAAIGDSNLLIRPPTKQG